MIRSPSSKRVAQAKQPPAPGPEPAPLAEQVRRWVARQSAEAWVGFKRREGINGALRGEFLHRRLWFWDGQEAMARHWHLIAWRPDEDSTQIKYVLSNTAADIAVPDLARAHDLCAFLGGARPSRCQGGR